MGVNYSNFSWNEHKVEQTARENSGEPLSSFLTSSEIMGKEKLEKSKKQDMAQFEARKPLYRLEDVVLNDEVKEQIATLRSRIDNHRLLYEEWGLAQIDPQGTHISVSFYGPPGTGKTMCAEALAAELGVDIIEVNYAEIESKYVGETGKNIRAAFQQATQANALLFFDEADAILGARMSNVTQAADHAVDVARAVMLKELDAFQGVVVFATNKFGKYDAAFLRRILQHIEVPLPDAPTRERLWRRLTTPRIPGREELQWKELAEASEGMSGGEIKNAIVTACSEAAARPEKRISQELCLKTMRRVLESKQKHDGGVDRTDGATGKIVHRALSQEEMNDLTSEKNTAEE
ncbi:MAG: 26S protease regulatory subunit [Thermoguttaceae bacterium]|nr:26S protease regulatory subunit [Thermoguttaceae bacterium]